MYDHFQTVEILRFKLKDGSQFGYKPMTAGEENSYLNEYMVEKEVTLPNGEKGVRMVQDITKLNKVLTYNLVESPYEEWDKLSKEQRWKILCQLKPEIFSEIINQIKVVTSGGDQKKN